MSEVGQPDCVSSLFPVALIFVISTVALLIFGTSDSGQLNCDRSELRLVIGMRTELVCGLTSGEESTRVDLMSGALSPR